MTGRGPVVFFIIILALVAFGGAMHLVMMPRYPDAPDFGVITQIRKQSRVTQAPLDPDVYRAEPGNITATTGFGDNAPLYVECRKCGRFYEVTR